jgi:predicted methyltransferase
MTPLVTAATQARLRAAAAAGADSCEVSLDLGRSTQPVAVDAAGWRLGEARYPWIEPCRERTVYHWDGAAFAPVARFAGALLKLVPTEWGPPTFEIDGIKMLPTAQVSPWEDAARKVSRVAPRGARMLDTCGGLGYFAARALEAGAADVHSFEKSPDVLWLRQHNPWSPRGDEPGYRLECADVLERIGSLASGGYDAVLHDPPRFGIAGELYSQDFYDELTRVLVPRGRLFHYTGTPNRVSRGRDLPREVAARLERAGFKARLEGDGVVAEKKSAGAR